MRLLEVKGLSKRFRGVAALSKVSLEIDEGELVGLIGPNGSGKTTLFDCVTGFIVPDEGRVYLNGEDITNQRPDSIALKGVVRTFQSARLFLKLTVLDNMILAIQQHWKKGYLAGISNPSVIRALEYQAREKALNLLHLVDLETRVNDQARSLSYGQRKLLTVAMALMPNPKVVLLDEPTAAVNPVLIEKMKAAIRALNEQGQTFLIIEHKVDFLADLCDKVMVLDHGEKIAEGTPEDILRNSRVIEAYFGGRR